MNSSFLKLSCFFLYLLIACAKIAAASSLFSASVDNNTIEPGGVITLTLEMAASTADAPDLGPLKRDFDILSQSRSSQSQYINGHRSAKTLWTLEISPKSDDKILIIPSIKLGSHQSNPVTISQAAGGKQAIKKDQQIQFNAFVDTKSAFIKEQIILTIELKTSLPLQNGSIDKPSIDDAIMESLGEDELIDVIENGIKYHKFKRRYALFFTTPAQVVIKPISFEGTIHRGAGGGRQGFLDYFSAGQRIRAKTNPIEITIKNIPDSYPKDRDFLPLKSFIISESLDNNETFKVSKATARKFELRALGTLASFLPAIDVPHIDNVQIYAEPGEKLQKNTVDGLETSSNFSHVFIPLAPHKLHVGKQEIYWWDTINHQVKTVSIRALDADVTGSAPLPTPPTPAPPSDDPVPLSKPAEPPQVTTLWWPLIALSSLALWLVTLGYFLARRKKNRAVNQHTESTGDVLVKNIVKAVDHNLPKEVLSHMQALKNYALTDHGEPIILHKDFFDNLTSLESALYHPQKSEINSALLKNIKSCVLSIKKTEKKHCDLKTLYPN